MFFYKFLQTQPSYFVEYLIIRESALDMRMGGLGPSGLDYKLILKG